MLSGMIQVEAKDIGSWRHEHLMRKTMRLLRKRQHFEKVLKNE